MKQPPAIAIVRPVLRGRVAPWAILILIISPFVVATLFLLPQWIRMVRGESPLDVGLGLAVPGFIAILAATLVGFQRFTKRMAKASVFSREGFEILGVHRPWSAVEGLYVNPAHEYMVLLLTERWDGGDTGFAISKREVAPDFRTLVELARACHAPVEDTRPYTHVDLWRERTCRHPPPNDPDYLQH